MVPDASAAGGRRVELDGDMRWTSQVGPSSDPSQTLARFPPLPPSFGSSLPNVVVGFHIADTQESSLRQCSCRDGYAAEAMLGRLH
ncbi:hypothetical protein ZEAMMB73_Zm00001d039143 [Zea mays]|uniref:Uncharacterized protein n=1 Tax=Zea mays TaxID=4577 RepID=A0A1D6MDV1_MAIZE|nr:hypothetical protein ZEAMMB73_Zm00001d039143 [Zea mays]